MPLVNTATAEAEKAPAASKPVSSTLCHAGAIVCACSAGFAVFVMFSKGGGLAELQAGAALFGAAVLWWALGDIVKYLHTIANKR